jgi:hypothetical protein
MHGCIDITKSVESLTRVSLFLSLFLSTIFQEDGFDETLIPVDFQSAGQIIDDDILKILVKPMREGVHVTVLMDCCHS